MDGISSALLNQTSLANLPLGEPTGNDASLTAAATAFQTMLERRESATNGQEPTGPSPIDASDASNETEKLQAELAAELQQKSQEFESLFLSMMLKEMRNTLDSEEGGLFKGEGSDTYGGMFDMFMSQHLAKSQPLGIGTVMEHYLNGSQSAAENEPATNRLEKSA